MIELENTYLAKELPEGLALCEHKEVIDVYLPASSPHPQIRLRKNGDVFELTKKSPIKDGDASQQLEETINLTQEEFDVFNSLDGKRIHKIRYYYKYNGQVAEVDVFQDDLYGLVVIDFEFDTAEDKDAFVMPSFCLADVTQELFIAGGMLCGSTYQDIKADLDRFGYKKLSV